MGLSSFVIAVSIVFLHLQNYSFLLLHTKVLELQNSPSIAASQPRPLLEEDTISR
jgi:hypothetical protein